MITETVCKVLKVPNFHKIVRTCVFPDEYDEFLKLPNGKSIKVIHHSPLALKAAWEHLKRARKRVIANEDYSKELGIALHYIQDYTVDTTCGFFIFKWRSSEAHNQREDNLVNEQVSKEAIEKGLKIRTPNSLKKAIFSAKPERDPEKIMYLATKLSAAAVATVLYPERDGYGWKKALSIHIAIVALPFILVAINMWFLLMAMVLSCIVHKLDPYYHKAKTEKEWFDNL